MNGWFALYIGIAAGSIVLLFGLALILLLKPVNLNDTPEAVASPGKRRRARAGRKKKTKHAGSNLKRDSSFAARLRSAGLALSARFVVLITMVMGALLGVFFLSVLSWPLPLALIAGGVLAFVLLQSTLAVLINRRREAFRKYLPDALDVMVRGLRSGLPVHDTVRAAGEDIPAPVGTVFTEIENEVRLGVQLETAMAQAAERVALQEFQFLATVLNLQRDMGGNLTEVLQNLSQMLRRRQRMVMKVNAIASEARASAKLVGLLPVAVFFIFVMISPDYAAVLTDDWVGRLLLGVAALSSTIGFVVMARLAHFEI